MDAHPRARWPRPVPLIGDPTRAAERAADPSGWAFDEASVSALHAVIGARRDVRRYRADPVPPELLHRVLAAAGLDVTTVHPTMLTNGETGEAPVVRDATTVGHVSGMPKVSRAALATAMLDAAEDPATVGRRLIVTRPGKVR